MGKYKIEIFFLIIVPFVFLFCPGAHIRYYCESVVGNSHEFFSKVTVCAYNDNDSEVFGDNYGKNVINIPYKYRKYDFYFSGEIINGIKDVFVSVNNEPVSDVSLSFPQGNRWFWEDFYLMKIFSCDIKLRSGTNVITIKSGKRKEKIIVHVGSD